jgi:hypothetical protein
VTSNINFAAINENFPVAGQDNDTQVFRDNFDTIKTSLRAAQEEITDLQDNVIRSDQTNEFNGNIISGAVLQNNRDAFYDGGAIVVPISLEYGNGNYQKIRFGADVEVGFLGFPATADSPPGVGKVTLELYGDGTERTITLSPAGGISYKKKSSDSGFTWSGNTFVVQSTSNPIFIELWKYNDSTVYVNYIGEFS